MKILVLGAGGIGGYYGGRLAQAGVDVTFLVRQRRREQIAGAGLVIESPRGDARLQPRTVLAEELRAEYDIVLLTCKAWDLDAALEAVAPAMEGEGECAIVPLLNGVAHLERLDARFGPGKVMGGTCQINVTLRPDGVVHHLDPLQNLFFGERDGKISARARALAEAFGRSSLDWRLSDDILQDMWEKLAFLTALAAMTCLMRANIGEIMATDDGKEIVERCLDANIQIAARAGHPPRPQAIAFAHQRLTQPGGLQSASMLRDLESSGPVEADLIVGFMLRKARAYGIDDTLLAIAYAHLQAYEARRAAGRLPLPR